MADILDAAQTNQTPSTPSMDQNAPVPPVVNDQIPPEPAPEPPIPPIVEPTPEPPPSAESSPSDSLIIPPPSEPAPEEKSEEAKLSEPPVSTPPLKEEKLKKKLSPAVIATAILFLFVTLPLIVFYVSQPKNLTYLRSFAWIPQGTSESKSGGVKPGGEKFATNEKEFEKKEKESMPSAYNDTTPKPPPGSISTTGGANTQTTTYTGTHVCDLLGSNCDATKISSLTVTQNFTNGQTQYTVVYSDHTEITVVNTVNGKIVTQLTLKDGKTTTTYSSEFQDKLNKRCTDSGDCATGQSCGAGTCSGVGCTSDSQCGGGRCGAGVFKVCEPKAPPPMNFFSPPEINPTIKTTTPPSPTDCFRNRTSVAVNDCLSKIPGYSGPTAVPQPPPSPMKSGTIPETMTIYGPGPISCTGSGYGNFEAGTVSEPCAGGGYLIEKIAHSGCSGSERCWCTSDSSNCTSGGGGSNGGNGGNGGTTPTNPPSQCIALIAYKDGNALSTSELAALKVGDTITLAFAPGGATTKVRFAVNPSTPPVAGDWHETTTKNANGQFVWDYTLANTTSFDVKAQWFDGSAWH